jgi:hypothetical protein
MKARLFQEKVNLYDFLIKIDVNAIKLFFVKIHGME